MVTTRSSQPFHRIAGRYRFVNRIISFGMDSIWRKQAIKALHLEEGQLILDLGCGSGEMLELVPRRSVRVGLDPAPEMLHNSTRPFHRVCGYGEQIPIKSRVVDRVMSAFVLRNLTDRNVTFKELHRVMKRGGQGALLDFSPPERGLWGGLAKEFIWHGIPALGGLLARDCQAYKYLSRTILTFAQPEVIIAELMEAGFDEVRSRRLVGGVNVLYTFRKVHE